ncbi:MAG: hypothetical protein H0W24_00810 [Lysobacter sp.]|nr:hypothetical protein [Lysobacter sp.]
MIGILAAHSVGFVHATASVPATRSIDSISGLNLGALHTRTAHHDIFNSFGVPCQKIISGAPLGL